MRTKSILKAKWKDILRRTQYEELIALVSHSLNKQLRFLCKQVLQFTRKNSQANLFSPQDNTDLTGTYMFLSLVLNKTQKKNIVCKLHAMKVLSLKLDV